MDAGPINLLAADIRVPPGRSEWAFITPTISELRNRLRRSTGSQTSVSVCRFAAMSAKSDTLPTFAGIYWSINWREDG